MRSFGFALFYFNQKFVLVDCLHIYTFLVNYFKMMSKRGEEAMIKTELTRFCVKEGASKLVDEWLDFLNENMHDVLLTLNDEKMYVECIFREKTSHKEYLYWFSVQGEGGQDVTESTSWIDQKHLAYWYACIDENVPAVDMTSEVVMISDAIHAKMV